MTFDAFETSDSRPVEFLTFANGSTQIRYTNAARDITIGSFVFTAIAYRRTEPRLSKNSDDAQIRVTLPRNATVLAFYSGVYTSNLTTLTIEKYHADDLPTPQLAVTFKGEVASVVRADEDATMLVIPIQQSRVEIPRYTHQFQCNAFLYDTPGCRLDRDDFNYDSTITSIDSTGLVITFAGLRARAVVIDGTIVGTVTSQELDTYFLAGYIETAAGELREIMEADVGGEADRVRILQPFRSAVAGDAAQVFAGCVKSIDICNRKFNNAINFQGFAYVPEVDPSNTELPAGSRTSSGNFAGVQP